MTDWIVQTITDFGYLGIVALMLLESIFPPIPSELIIPFAGYAAADGQLNVVGVVLAASLGSVLGMLPWYFAGRWFGLGRVRALADRYGRWLTLNADEVDNATRWFTRFGPIIVLLGRLVPIIRTLISVPAGLARMPLPLFLGVSLVGIAIWNSALVGAGYLLHEHHHIVEEFLDPVTIVLAAVVVLVYLYRLVTWRPSGVR